MVLELIKLLLVITKSSNIAILQNYKSIVFTRNRFYLIESSLIHKTILN